MNLVHFLPRFQRASYSLASWYLVWCIQLNTKNSTNVIFTKMRLSSPNPFCIDGLYILWITGNTMDTVFTWHAEHDFRRPVSSFPQSADLHCSFLFPENHTANILVQSSSNTEATRTSCDSRNFRTWWCGMFLMLFLHAQVVCSHFHRILRPSDFLPHCSLNFMRLSLATTIFTFSFWGTTIKTTPSIRNSSSS